MKRSGLYLAMGSAILAATYIGCTSISKQDQNSQAMSGANLDSSRDPAQYQAGPYGRAANNFQVKNVKEVDPKFLKAYEAEAKLRGGNLRFMDPMTADEATELWHLSEGSEVFPLKWFMLLSSEFSSLKESTKLHQRLDEKYGVVAEPDEMAKRSPYPLKWIGLTAAWSDEAPDKSDVRLLKGETIESKFGIRDVVTPEGQRRDSIAMVGVNCAFCHTSEISVNGRKSLIEGAPNMLSIRGFFQDMFGSSAKTMLDKDLLIKFLKDSGYSADQGLLEKLAEERVHQFKKELGLTGLKAHFADYVIRPFSKNLYEDLKKDTLRAAFFKHRDVVTKNLIELLKMSYRMNEVSPVLQRRMEWLAISLGVDPNMPVTPEGYARTDAFGRIANWVARINDPIPLTATTSVPSMWDLKYRAFFHWNGNTNSVVMRNLGQSFGLGAILENPNAEGPEKFNSTANLHNLHQLESYLYKIPAPHWGDVASTSDNQIGLADVDIPKAIQGCNIYLNKCATCHEPASNRVGPTQELIAHRVFPLKAIGTDATYTHNQATEVDGVPFKDALFNFTGAVRDQYYKRYNVSEAEQAEWEHRGLRGQELFRDTVLGFPAAGDGPLKPESEYFRVKKDSGYIARHLAGIWASAPYLHNGSVPSIADLLKPASQRPKFFYVGSRELDTKKLGFKSDFNTVPSISPKEREILRNKVMERLTRQLKSQNQGATSRLPSIDEIERMIICEAYPARCFDTRLTGNSNVGHEGEAFGTTLPAQSKAQLIEFLKILRPEVEYSRPVNPIYTISADGESCSAFE